LLLVVGSILCQFRFRCLSKKTEIKAFVSVLLYTCDTQVTGQREFKNECMSQAGKKTRELLVNNIAPETNGALKNQLTQSSTCCCDQ